MILWGNSTLRETRRGAENEYPAGAACDRDKVGILVGLEIAGADDHRLRAVRRGDVENRNHAPRIGIRDGSANAKTSLLPVDTLPIISNCYEPAPGVPECQRYRALMFSSRSSAAIAAIGLPL